MLKNKQNAGKFAFSGESMIKIGQKIDFAYYLKKKKCDFKWNI